MRSLRAPQQRFKPQQHTLRPHFHTSMKPRKEWGRGVVQNASFNPQNRTFGDQTWSPKKASSNTTCNPFRRGILRLGQLLLHLQQATCIPIAVEGWVPCATTPRRKSRRRSDLLHARAGQTHRGAPLWSILPGLFLKQSISGLGFRILWHTLQVRA